MSVASISLEEELAGFYKDASQDASPLYQRLHHDAPVIRGPGGAWIVSRYDDVNTVSRELSAVWRRRKQGVTVADLRPMDRFRYYNMNQQETNGHDRLRGLVSQAFTARAVAQIEFRIAFIVDKQIDDALEKGAMNLVDDFSYPLPIMVISEMLGIPEEHLHQLSDVSRAIVLALDHTATEAERINADNATTEFGEMIFSLVDDRRRSPKDDLLTSLAQANMNADVLSKEELRSVAFELSVAGHETTANLISSLTYRLLEERSRWE